MKPIRELFGVMAANGVREGIFVTTTSFSGEAREFADGKALELIDGSTFLEKIRQLPADAQTKLLGIATDGDYTRAHDHRDPLLFRQCLGPPW